MSACVVFVKATGASSSTGLLPLTFPELWRFQTKFWFADGLTAEPADEPCGGGLGLGLGENLTKEGDTAPPPFLTLFALSTVIREGSVFPSTAVPTAYR